MKTALFLLAAAGHYCGVDVPFDVSIEGETMEIVRAEGSERCDISGTTATCEGGQIMTVKPTPDAGITLDWDGLKYVIVMPAC